MNSTKRNDLISVKKVKFVRTSIYDISLFETNEIEFKKKSSCKKSSKRRVSFDLNNQFVEHNDRANRDH